MTPILSYLSSARVNGIMQGITDPRLLPGKLVWNTRVPDVPAAEEEIMAKYVGQLLIADLVADDAKAVTYSQGRFQFESAKVPNLKMGAAINQAMLNALQRIQAMGGVPNDDVGLFTNYQNRLMANVKYGVELRKEVLKVSMLLDGFSYDRLGIKMSNATWGMYSDLKITTGVAWSSTSGVGLTDIQTARSIAAQRYGINLNRATMSTPALRALVAQTEYINQVKNVYLASSLGGPTVAAPLQSDGFLKRLAEQIIAGTGEAFTIELDDRRYWHQSNNGEITSSRIHPIDRVLLTSTENDGNSNAYDFANGIVTESIVGGMLPGGVIGGVPQFARGPIAYTTGNPDLNPPNVTIWGVARGFPRKHMQAASAVLNVGTLTETFDTALPAVL